MAQSSRTLSQKAYAKHRGCALRAVQVAVQTGRITADANGRIDPRRADAEWRDNTNEMMQPKNGKRGPQAAAIEHDGAPITYTQAKIKRELAEAKIAELKHAQLAAKLIDAERVKKQAHDEARKMRDRLLGLTKQLPVMLANQPRIKCEKILTDAIRKVCNELADGE